MRLLISLDIEGVAGVVHPEQTRDGQAAYEAARHLMTQEANAAISGAFDAGADEVLVSDAHGSYRNLLADELDPRARPVLGKPRQFGMIAGLQGCAAVLLVGYHARAQSRGVLAHTINSGAFAGVWMNDQAAGEAELYGALAAEFGVPVIFASGDDVFIEEIRPVFTEAVLVATKEALGRHAAVSLSPKTACAALRAGVSQALLKLAAGKIPPPRRLEPPITIRLQTTTPAHADLFCLWPTLERTDASTVRFTAPSVEHAVRMLNSFSAMAFMLR